MLRFAVLTDLHDNFIPDGVRRIKEVIDKLQGEQIDFIVSLGDLCLTPENAKTIMNALRSEGVPVYYAFGNHDVEATDKQELLHFYGLASGYYSFRYGHTKFIVLDANYKQRGDKCEVFSWEDYDREKDLFPIIPKEELEWLQAEMEDESLQYIIFSHHSLANDFPKRGIVNRVQVRSILEKRKTVLCMNGHDHGDDCREINGIPYYTLNSLAYIWHGTKEMYSYSEELHERYPRLKDVIMYEEALFGIVELEEKRIAVRGMKGSYQTITPEQVGIGERWNGILIAPQVSDYNRKLEVCEKAN